MFIEFIIVAKLASLIAAAAIGTAIILAFLYWDEIVNWFQQFSTQIQNNPNLKAVSIAEDMKTGNCSFVQGIFDTKTEKFIDARRVSSQDVDERIKEVHKDNKVAVYT